MLNAAKNDSLSPAGPLVPLVPLALRVFLLLVVTLCLGQTRVWGFGVTLQPASGVFESVTPSSIGENYDGCPYDVSDSLLAPKTGLFSTIGGKGMDSALFNRIPTAFQRKPGRVLASNPASELHLGPNRLIEGETMTQNVIALRMNPSTSSVYEELIHTAQLRRGMDPKTQLIQMEIEAAQKLIRFAERYKIPASETAATVERFRILQGGSR